MIFAVYKTLSNQESVQMYAYIQKYGEARICILFAPGWSTLFHFSFIFKIVGVFQAVIIARYSGAISVCCVTNLRNLLGESPEFLAGPPQVSSLCSDHGFLGLECETTLTAKKYPWDGSISQSEIVSNLLCLIMH